MAADNAAILARQLQADDALVLRFQQAPDQVCAEHGIPLNAQQAQDLRNAVTGKSIQEIRDQIAGAGLRTMW